MTDSKNDKDPQLVRENARRQKLNWDRRVALTGSAPVERAKWLARDEALTRGFLSPDEEL
jgi:hypothetical protein